MKQRRHPIKNQSEAFGSVTLQKGLWRRARALNARLHGTGCDPAGFVFAVIFFSLSVMLYLNVTVLC